MADFLPDALIISAKEFCPAARPGLLAGQEAAVNLIIPLRKAAKDYLLQVGGMLNEGFNGRNCDFGCLLEWVSINPGADGWERHRADFQPGCDFKRAPVAGGEQFRFAVVSAVPHRPNRVDDIPRRQIVTFGQLGVTGTASAHSTAFVQQSRSGCPVDRAV